MFRFFDREKRHIRQAMDLEGLSTALERLSKTIPSMRGKTARRTHLLRAIATQEVLPSALVRLKRGLTFLSSEAKPSHERRAILRERLLTHPLPPPLFLRRAWVFATLAVFFLTIVFSFTYELPTTFAKRQTYVEPLTGDVFLYREAQGERVFSRTVIREGDLLTTGKEGKAAVYFFDDTVARLAPETRLKIDTMFISRTNPSETVISVSLETGKLWANVVNLPSTALDVASHFGVRAENVVVGTSQQAAFSVSKDHGVRVAAVKNPVTVRIAQSSTKLQKTIVSPGHVLHVSGSVQQEKAAANDAWAQENLISDVSYVKRVLARYRKERDQILAEFSGNPIAPLQEASEKAKLLLTTDPIERGKKLLSLATRQLLSSEQAFDRGDIASGQNFLASYKQTVSEMLANEPPPALHELLAEHIASQRKALALIPPTSSLYAAKEAVREVERHIASDPASQKRIELAQASDKLFEVRALLENAPSPSLAVSYLKDYQAKTNKLIAEITLLDDATKAELLPALFDRTAQDLALLQNLDTSVSGILSETVASVEKSVAQVTKAAQQQANEGNLAQTSVVHDGVPTEGSTTEIVAAPENAMPLPRLQLFFSGEVEGAE